MSKTIKLIYIFLLTSSPATLISSRTFSWISGFSARLLSRHAIDVDVVWYPAMKKINPWAKTSSIVKAAEKWRNINNKRKYLIVNLRMRTGWSSVVICFCRYDGDFSTPHSFETKSKKLWSWRWPCRFLCSLVYPLQNFGIRHWTLYRALYLLGCHRWVLYVHSSLTAWSPVESVMNLLYWCETRY